MGYAEYPLLVILVLVLLRWSSVDRHTLLLAILASYVVYLTSVFSRDAIYRVSTSEAESSCCLKLGYSICGKKELAKIAA
jgi:hypothetical protein